MSKWRFSREGNNSVKGANTVAGLLAGHQPFFQADNLISKRNVIATTKGWIRRQNYTDMHGTDRTKDEVLVAAHPGTSAVGGYANIAHLGFPDIAQVYANGTLDTNDGRIQNIARDTVIVLHVVFNEPIAANSAGGSSSITLANTASGNSSKVANSVPSEPVINANNTLSFRVTMGLADGGTYKIGGQTIANATVSAVDIVSLNPGANEQANLVITGAVSNAYGEIVVVIV